MSWSPLDTWIVVVGALAAVACALPGTFLVLRGMSMMADAIAHSVLPGIVLAFLIAGSFSTVPLLVGAGLVGVAAAVCVQWIHERSGLDAGAATGVVFTGLFALGMLGVRLAADHVDLDLDCVLFGSLETTPLHRVRELPGAPPRAAVVLAGVASVNLAVILLLFKELQLATFDPEQAQAQGLRPRRLQRVVMVMTAASTVAAFEAVGSLLVLAMIVTPAATARLLTRGLGRVLLLASGLAVLFVLVGHLAAITLPGPILRALDPVAFARIEDVSTPGSIASVAMLVFALAAFRATRQRRRRLRHGAGVPERPSLS